MAYRVYEKYASGSAKSYIDTNTGNILSTTRYRNLKAKQEGKPTLGQKEKQKAQSQGYSSPYQKAKAKAQSFGFNTPYQQKKAAIYQRTEYNKVKSVHHAFNLGLPIDRTKAIQTTVENNPQFGYGMLLYVHATITPESGPPYEQVVGSYVHKKSTSDTLIEKMIDEVFDGLVRYGESFVIHSWHLVLVDDL